MISKKSLLAIVVILMFCVSAVPTASAYKGYQLSRGPVDDFILTNQDNESMNLSDFRGDIVWLHLFLPSAQMYVQLLRNYYEACKTNLAKNIKNMSQLFQ